MTTTAGGGFSNWQDLRTHLIEAYADTPHATTEQEIIDAYELHPAAVTKAALELIGNPEIRSAWAVLKTRSTKIAQAPSNPSARTGVSREKAVARAEQWVRAAGLHYDRDSEILLELFGGPSALLGSYAHIEIIPDTTTTNAKWKLGEPTGDTSLVEHILNVYNQARPKGIAVEETAAQRANAWKHQQARIAEIKARMHAELDAKQAEPSTDPDSTLPDDVPF